jgi:hypothetical protein
MGRIGGGKEVDELLTLCFESNPDVNDRDLEIFSMAESKSSTCRSGSGADNERGGHNEPCTEAILYQIGSHRTKIVAIGAIGGQAKRSMPDFWANDPRSLMFKIRHHPQ